MNNVVQQENKETDKGVFSSLKVPSSRLAALVVPALLTTFGLGGCKLIESGEVGVERRLGKVSSQTVDPGLTLYFPPTTDIEVVSLKDTSFTYETMMYSKDTQQVATKVNILFSRNPETVIEVATKVAGDPFVTIALPAFNNAMKEVASEYSAQDMLGKREEMAQKVLTLLQKNPELHRALSIKTIQFENFDLSDRLEHAIEEKQVKEQEAKAKEYEVQKSKKDAEMRVIQAEAEAKALQAKAQVLKENPALVLQQILEKWDGKTPQTLVVGDDVKTMIPVK